MKKIRKYLALAAGCTFFGIAGQAQIIMNDNISIYTGFEPRLADVEKFNDQPSIADTFSAKPDSAYILNASSVPVKFTPDTIAAVKMKTEPLQKLRRIFLKFGFGNYLSPYVDAEINSLRAKTNSYAFRYTHFSSHGIISNVGSPWISDNEAAASYNHFFKNMTLNLDAEYYRNVVHFYGYNPNTDTTLTRDTVRQRFNRGVFRAELFSTHRTDLIKVNHKTGLDFYHWDDRYGSSENKVNLYGDVNRFTDLFAGETFGGKYALTYLQYKTDSVGVNHGFFMDLAPYLKFGGPEWGLHVGVKLALGVDDSTRFNVYPDIDFHVNIFRKFIRFYIQATGRYERQDFFTITKENPFIRPSSGLRNLNEYVRGKIGLRGAFTDNIGYNAGVQVAYAKNMMFYASDTINKVQRGFEILYDQGLYFNAFGELSVVFGEKLRVLGRINYHMYKPENLRDVYHKPFLDGSISAMYNLKNKFIAKIDLNFISPQKVRAYEADTINVGQVIEKTVEVKGLIDANISLEYRLRPWLGFFVNVNNIAAMRYNRWYGYNGNLQSAYPTQGLNVLGGFTLSF